MSAPVPDIDELLFNMDLLHQQLLQKGIIGAKLVDSFMESLSERPESLYFRPRFGRASVTL